MSDEKPTVHIFIDGEPVYLTVRRDVTLVFNGFEDAACGERDIAVRLEHRHDRIVTSILKKDQLLHIDEVTYVEMIDAARD